MSDHPQIGRRRDSQSNKAARDKITAGCRHDHESNVTCDSRCARHAVAIQQLTEWPVITMPLGGIGIIIKINLYHIQHHNSHLNKIPSHLNIVHLIINKP